MGQVFQEFEYTCHGKDDWFNCWLISEMVRRFNEPVMGILHFLREKTKAVHIGPDMRSEIIGDDNELKEFLDTPAGKAFDRIWPEFLCNRGFVKWADEWIPYSGVSLRERLEQERREKFISVGGTDFPHFH